MNWLLRSSSRTCLRKSLDRQRQRFSVCPQTRCSRGGTGRTPRGAWRATAGQLVLRGRM